MLTSRPGAPAVGDRDRRRYTLVTTFQECRAHVGLETTRGRCRATVLTPGGPVSDDGRPVAG